LGKTLGELRATMTLPEFFSWQAYAKAKARELDRQAPARPAELPELGALGPGGIAHAIRGR
jgi:hypothetical protein